MEQIAIDGDTIQRQEVAGGKETIRRPDEAEQDMRGLRGFEEISQPYRCDRVERFGGTEMQNRKRLLQIGVTKMFKSVAPDENLDQLSELDVTEGVLD